MWRVRPLRPASLLAAAALTIALPALAVAPAQAAATCFGQAATIDYSASTTGQSITGTSGPDVIVGGSGGDTIDGLGGDDRICGGGGEDVLYGGEGADELDGGDRDDQLKGGPGPDYLVGGETGEYYGDWADYFDAPGAVQMTLGGTGVVGDAEGDTTSGVENIIGSAFNDSLVGDGEANRIQGGDGPDYIAGAGGDDVIVGQAGVDSLYGNGGEDTIDGGAGADLLNGGTGDDDISDPSGGNTLSYYQAPAAVTITLNQGAILAAIAGDGRINLSTGSAGVDHVDVGLLAVIEGSSYGDTMTANDVTCTFRGGEGDDTLVSTGLSDCSLYGQEGDDTLRDDEGDDYLDGGPDDDSLSFASADAGVTVDLGISGTQDTGLGEKQVANIEQLSGTPHADELTAGADDVELRGLAGADTLTGGPGEDRLEGGPGPDSITGGEGFDWLAPGAGNDTVTGDSSDQAVLDYSDASAGVTVALGVSGLQHTGGSGDDTLIGSFGGGLIGSPHDDHLTGDAGDNGIDGSGGSDVLVGRGGSDHLYGEGPYSTGAAGADVLDGGPGDDTLNGGGGRDTARYASAPGRVVVSLATTDPQNTVSAGVDTLISIENLIGSRYGDKLTGNAGRNDISGGAGNDTIIGGGGPDRLDGGLGANHINGATVIGLPRGYSPFPAKAPVFKKRAKRAGASVVIRVKGTLRIPTGATKAQVCGHAGSDRVVLTIKKGARKLRTVSLSVSKQCGYAKRVTVKRSAVGKAKRLTTTFALKGNRALGVHRKTYRLPVR